MHIPYSRNVWWGKVWQLWQMNTTSPNQNHPNITCTLHSNWIVHQFAKFFCKKFYQINFAKLYYCQNIPTIRYHRYVVQATQVQGQFVENTCIYMHTISHNSDAFLQFNQYFLNLFQYKITIIVMSIIIIIYTLPTCFYPEYF